MVTKYKARPDEIRGDSHYTLPGDIEYVLASDYAALEAAYQTLLESHEILADSPTEDELRAELARVKAESLRVVADECQNMDIASDWYMTPDGLGWLGYDRHDCECVETPHGYHKFDCCRKVKLERWEETE